MKISIQVTHPHKQAKSCVVLGIYEGGELTPTAKQIDKASHGRLAKILKQSHFQGKFGQILPIFHLQGTEFEHLLLVGCGKANKLTPPVYRKLCVTAIKAISCSNATQATIYLTELKINGHSLPWMVNQLAQAAGEASYRFDQFKTEKEPACALQHLTLHLPTQALRSACEKALQQGQAIANGVLFTKNLANQPSNICTPTYLAQQALALGKTHRSLKVRVLNEADMKKLGMGAILAVSQGSAEEAKLITIEYQGAAKSKAPVALVGKGITFDTGGNSLKSPENMVGMKYDMCGAATVLGTLKAAAELKLPINIVGVIPAVENMPGGTGYKPEDILKSLSGQTIEVISTDAEGRLILADALTYTERYKPDVVIDIATLTGAVVIALGFHATGLLTNHQPLADALLKAGTESNDRAWQLPLWDEYQEQIKSPFADISNSGGRPAGTITAGCFLSRFAKKFRWAHLDVAGTAAFMINSGERSATGRPVPLLMQYLIDRSK